MIVRYDEPITDDVKIIEDETGIRLYWRGNVPPNDRWKLIEQKPK